MQRAGHSTDAGQADKRALSCRGTSEEADSTLRRELAVAPWTQVEGQQEPRHYLAVDWR